jgi:hypothetical protein
MKSVNDEKDLKPDQVLAQYVEDYFGGVVISCSSCDLNQNSGNELVGLNISEFCHGCGKELMYPRWASW